MFKSRRIKEEEPRRDEPETEERSAAKKVQYWYLRANSHIQFQQPHISTYDVLTATYRFT